MRKPPEGYALRPGVPAPNAYLRLRHEAGLTPRTHEQAVLALHGSWAACHVIDVEGGATAGMGRLIGDGGWYFHVVDMAVLPEHQRRGIGDAMLSALLARIKEVAPRGAWVTLLADPPGRRLYERHGFTETAPASTGMAQTLQDPDG